MNLTIILAAGKSSRLSELSFDRPKSLLSVGGHTIISRLCLAFSSMTDKYLIVSGKNTESIRDALADHNLNISYLEDNSVSDYGNAWSFKKAIDSINHFFPETCIVLEADVLLSPFAFDRFESLKHIEKFICTPVLSVDDDKLSVNTDGCYQINKSPIENSKVLGKYLGVGQFKFEKLKELSGRISVFSEKDYVHYLASLLDSSFKLLEINSENAFEIDTKEDYKKALLNPNFYRTKHLTAQLEYKSRELKFSGYVKRIVGVHDAFGAKIVQNNGFDALWLGSFQIALSTGQEDDSSFSPFQSLTLAEQINSAGFVLPMIIDAGNGFQDEKITQQFVDKAISLGIAGICVEDNIEERVCSLYTNEKRSLVGSEIFAARIKEFSKYANGKIQVIARTEALTTGLGYMEASTRLKHAINAGADVILPHYVDSDFYYIKEFFENYKFSKPIILIPTGLINRPIAEFKQLGCSAIVYANIDLRLRLNLLQDSYAHLSSDSFFPLEALAQPSELRAVLEHD